MHVEENHSFGQEGTNTLHRAGVGEGVLELGQKEGEVLVLEADPDVAAVLQ